jgi:hypothetical protein
MGGIYEVAIEMGSGVMIYIPNFIQIFFRHSKVNGGIHKHTDRIQIA